MGRTTQMWNGRAPVLPGEAHPQARLTERKVRALRVDLGKGRRTPTEIAKAEQVSVPAICMAAYEGGTWQHVPGALDGPHVYRSARRAWLIARGWVPGAAKRHQGQRVAVLSEQACRFLGRERSGSKEAMGRVLGRLLEELDARRGGSVSRLAVGPDAARAFPRGTERRAVHLPVRVIARVRREAGHEREPTGVVVDRLLRELRARRLGRGARAASVP